MYRYLSRSVVNLILVQDQRDLVRVIPYTYQGHGRNILRGLLTCLLLFYGMNYQSLLETVQRWRVLNLHTCKIILIHRYMLHFFFLCCVYVYVYVCMWGSVCMYIYVSAINVFLHIMSVYMFTTGPQCKLVNVTNCAILYK